MNKTIFFCGAFFPKKRLTFFCGAFLFQRKATKINKIIEKENTFLLLFFQKSKIFSKIFLIITQNMEYFREYYAIIFDEICNI